MKILAIETTDAVGTIALADGERLLGMADLPLGQGSARSLAPTIDSLLREAGWRPDDVRGIAVVTGPGSFTGLRVGVTTAKTFAFAVGAEVLGLDALEVVAAGAPADVSRLSVAIDAQRGEVVAGTFVRNADGEFAAEAPPRLIEIDAWLTALPAGSVVSGPILNKLGSRIPAHITPVPPEYRRPTAAQVARLAAPRFAAGLRDDLWKLVPRYSRRSAAEERLDGAART